MRNYFKNRIYKFLLFSIVAAFFFACEEDGPQISATLSGGEDIIQGDSTTLTLQITGENPPFAFRYYTESGFYNIVGIETNTYTFKVAPRDTTNYTAVSVASYSGPSEAYGSAIINVRPATYTLNQTLSPSKDGFLHASSGTNLSNALIDVRNQGAQWDRRGFMEFDAAEISKVHEKNQYKLTFWLAKSHAQGVGAGVGEFVIKGVVGELDESMTWATQPAETSYIQLFSKNFEPESTAQQIMFTGDITPIVNEALANPSSQKFMLKITEEVNKGLYYLASSRYEDETKRPIIDVYERDK